MGTNKAAVFFFVVCAIAIGAFFYLQKPTCLAGGGGSEHVAPASYSATKPVTLELKLNRWGAPECMKGNVMNDFTEVKCHYRVKGDADYTSQDMQGTLVDNDHAIYTCEIPAVKTEGEAELEYFFDQKMNGVYSRRDVSFLKSVNE